MNLVHHLARTAASAFVDRPVLVLTNGFYMYFSVGAMFTHVLKCHFGLKVVTVGGIRDKPIAIRVFCLGFTKISMNKEVLYTAQALGAEGFPPSL